MSIPRPIVITGSIAIDRIMSFPGSFAEHIQPDNLDSLSVSIFLESLTDSYGGVAANIAYNLALLEEEAYLVGSVGKDAVAYMERLARQGVNISHIYESDLPTASFNVITDADQNQVGGFYPGAMFDSGSLRLEHWYEKNPLVVIAPHDPKAMRAQIEECTAHRLSLCYDIGQQVSNAPAEDLEAGVRAAEILIVNEYEMAILSKKIGLSRKEIDAQIPVVVTTLGSDGSVISGNKVKGNIEIGIAEPRLVADPTGAGDAYRAGFMYGYARGWPLRSCAQLGAVCASVAVETLGTQTHTYDKQGILERYQTAFGEKPPLS